MTHTAVGASGARPSVEIAREIRAEVGRQQLSSRRLAVKSGMSYEWLKRRITTCTVALTFEDVDLIARALGVPASRFYKIPGNGPSPSGGLTEPYLSKTTTGRDRNLSDALTRVTAVAA